jgi:hypothetical protein
MPAQVVGIRDGEVVLAESGTGAVVKRYGFASQGAPIAVGGGTVYATVEGGCDAGTVALTAIDLDTGAQQFVADQAIVSDVSDDGRYVVYSGISCTPPMFVVDRTTGEHWSLAIDYEQHASRWPTHARFGQGSQLVLTTVSWEAAGSRVSVRVLDVSARNDIGHAVEEFSRPSGMRMLDVGRLGGRDVVLANLGGEDTRVVALDLHTGAEISTVVSGRQVFEADLDPATGALLTSSDRGVERWIDGRATALPGMTVARWR